MKYPKTIVQHGSTARPFWAAMRACILILGLSLGTAMHLRAEAFKVLHFHSDIRLNADGSFDVVEDILLEFSESKHGFIRKLPYRYTPAPNVQGEIAAGHQNGHDIIAPITEIAVEGRVFTVTKSYSDYEIKIGSGDEYVTGRQRYRLHYKVYGAINHFSQTSEFYWNVNGNDWEVEFDTIDATVTLPTTKKMADADLQVFTGEYGAVRGGVATIATPGKVQFLGTRRLSAQEGMTIVLRFPKGYLRNEPVPMRVLADVYMIDSLRAVATLQHDGSIGVEESVWVDVLQANAELPFILGRNPALSTDNGVPLQIEYEFLDAKVRRDGYDFMAFGTLDPPQMLKISGGSFPNAGKYHLKLSYRIWGATMQSAQMIACYVPLFSTTPDAPIAAAHFDFRWSTPNALETWEPKFSTDTPGHGKVTKSPTSMRLDFDAPFQAYQSVDFQLKLREPKVKVTAIPMHIYSPGHYYTFYHADIELRTDGTLHIANRFGVYKDTWYSPEERPLMMEHSDWGSYEFLPYRPQFWGKKGLYRIQNLQFQGELVDYGDERDHHLRLASPKGLQDAGGDTIAYSYDILYGPVTDSVGKRWIEFPVIEKLAAPADIVTFTLRTPGLPNLSRTALWITMPYGAGKIDLTHAAEESNGVMAGGMREGELLLMRLPYPDSGIHTSWTNTLGALWVNHRALFIPLFFLLPLFIIWFGWGRDRRFTTVVEFYPPEELTPAEAGMLIDDKLHNRDLLSLIYYWGAQGYISITELYDSDGGVKDYQFQRLKKLPATARKYERTIFNQLFSLGNITTVSGHHQTFAGTMSQARTELNDHVKAKKFYVPGTQGWAMGMNILAVLLTIIAVCGAGLVVFEFNLWFRGRWEIPFGWGAAAALCFFFARIMPKKAGFGLEQYKKLVGFREFILRARKDELEELVHTNPDYFGMTLPYAIALGIATKWVENFGALLTEPPKYYQGSHTMDPDYWQRQEFARIMQRQLDRMSLHLNSSPPSTSSGGGSSSSYSSSSSSSSYSSSGSSGGSSYSSGGGYSGGGYGGGGGSSW